MSSISSQVPRLFLFTFLLAMFVDYHKSGMQPHIFQFAGGGRWWLHAPVKSILITSKKHPI
jgi:hypothetical protein